MATAWDLSNVVKTPHSDGLTAEVTDWMDGACGVDLGYLQLWVTHDTTIDPDGDAYTTITAVQLRVEEMCLIPCDLPADLHHLIMAEIELTAEVKARINARIYAHDMAIDRLSDMRGAA